MGFFDTLLTAIAPERAVKRVAAQTAIRAINSGYSNYGASLHKKSMRGWMWHGGSPKEDIEDNLRVLRERSRDAYMGVPLATGAIKTMRTNVVCGGLTPTPQIDNAFLGISDEEAQKINEQIAREFALWANKPTCDADRIDNFYMLQQLAFTGFLLNGDSWAVLQNKKTPGVPYDLRVRIIEADRICSPAFIVKIKVNGASKDFIVVQQGNPNTSTYDSSCNGTWLLMKDIYTTSTFGNNNSYKDSSIHTYLNGTFYNLIDSNIRAAIKQVKIPYQNGTGSGGSLATGSNGLSTKVFLLSGYEVGWTTSDNGYFPKDGVRLAYFGNSSSGNSKRIAYNGSSAAVWWLRSPYAGNSNGVWYVDTVGSSGLNWCNDSFGVRPAFILPSTLVVSDDGTVSVNTAPTVSTDGAALGRKNAAFAWKYTVRDTDGDTLTVTEKLDGKTTKTRTGVASGTALTFEQTASAAGFQKILNGNHTITVEVSDGKETVSTSATFTKAVHAASVTLAEPLAVEGDITVAVLQVTGSIPDDAKFKAEVTNNALDSSPVWQDATTEVKKGVNIVFENKTATNGAAFNFHVSVERGESGEGGYIEAVSGAFQ